MNSSTSKNSIPEALYPEHLNLLHSFLPQFLYYATICTIPYYQWRQLSPANPILKIDWLLVITLMAIVIPHIFTQKNIPINLKSNLWPWMLLFLVGNTASSLLSPYPTAAFSEILNTLLIGYIFIGLNLLMISKGGLTKIMPVVLAVSVGFNSFIGILQYFFNYMPFGSQVAERGRGLTIGANNMALMCVFTLPLTVHWAFHAKNAPSRMTAIAFLLINIFGIISSGSRGGFLSFIIISCLIVFELRHRFHPRYLGLIIGFLGIFAFSAVSLTPESYFERQSTILEGTEADKSTRRRTDYLLVGLESFKQNPIFGTGTLTFDKVWFSSEATRKYDFVERPAHNTYMEVLVGSGIIGLGIFVMLLFQSYANFSHAKKIFTEYNNEYMASLAAMYRLSFIAVLIYFVFKSGLDHKMFLLALPLSQLILNAAQEEMPRTKLDSTS